MGAKLRIFCTVLGVKNPQIGFKLHKGTVCHAHFLSSVLLPDALLFPEALDLDADRVLRTARLQR
jgi:hypothetical protein